MRQNKRKIPTEKKAQTVALPAETATGKVQIMFVVPDVEFIAAERNEE